MTDLDTGKEGIHLRLWLKTVGTVLAIFLITAWLVKTPYIMPAPFLFSLVISYLLHPTVNHLERRGLPRVGAIFLVLMGLLLTMGLFFIFLLPSVIRELQKLYTDFPAFISSLEREIQAWQARLMAHYPLLTQIGPVEKLAAFRNGLEAHLLRAVSLLSRTLTHHILFIPLLTFFLLRDETKIRKALLRLVPNRYFEMTFNIQYHLNRQIRNYLKGIILDAFVVGAITTSVSFSWASNTPSSSGSDMGWPISSPCSGPSWASSLESSWRLPKVARSPRSSP